jgi:hypothetical protein
MRRQELPKSPCALVITFDLRSFSASIPICARCRLNPRMHPSRTPKGRGRRRSIRADHTVSYAAPPNACPQLHAHRSPRCLGRKPKCCSWRINKNLPAWPPGAALPIDIVCSSSRPPQPLQAHFRAVASNKKARMDRAFLLGITCAVAFVCRARCPRHTPFAARRLPTAGACVRCAVPASCSEPSI